MKGSDIPTTAFIEGMYAQMALTGMMASVRPDSSAPEVARIQTQARILAAGGLISEADELEINVASLAAVSKKL